MQNTHEEVRRLIQLNADEALNIQEKNILSTHLEECSECRTYAEDIKEVESILAPVMRRHWNLQPIPLSMSALNVKGNLKIQTNTILTTRRLVVGVVFLAFIFSAWQFALSGRQTLKQPPVGVLPVPMPSARSTSTKISLQNCIEISYMVQKNDTLQSIAHRFAVSKEEIMRTNSMEAETLDIGKTLTIPICNFTPTGTINPTMLSATYTPSLSPIASTSGG